MHPSLPALLALSCAAYGLVSHWRNKRKNPTGLPLPPGPTPIPIVGNILGINPDQPWVSYSRWSKIYGDLVYSRFLNQDIIVINSEEIAKNILERRSYNYSDRPAILRMTNDFVGWHFSSAMLTYGDRWRLHRRLFHQAFRSQAATQYHTGQLQKARDLILNVLKTPEDYSAHLQMHAASIIMSVVYGYTIARRDDPIVNVVNKAVEFVVASVRPEVAAFLGFFPFLRFIPTWFPGASFQRSAVMSQKYAYEMIEVPFRFVQEGLATGTAVPSMVSNSLNRVNGQDMPEDYIRAIKESSGTAFAAAFETTFSTLLTFVLAMLLNPDVQECAQAEIDSIIGTARLPDFEDRPLLSYVEAVLRETLRWHPAAPLSIPHAATTADVYDGYFIPRGATIIMNTWAMTRNEAKYPNPEEFRPERFLDKNG
ncbi:cytochrome P450 [Chiua virens]|nr:cytochrome P450 [Chiua virens]